MRGVRGGTAVLGLVLSALGAPGASASVASEPDDVSILNPDPGCAPSARYVTPEGVAAEPDTGSGAAPADLPGTATRVNIPPEIAFPLLVDPLPVPREVLQTPRRPDNSLYLGDVTFNRQSRDVKIGGVLVNVPASNGDCR